MWVALLGSRRRWKPLRYVIKEVEGSLYESKSGMGHPSSSTAGDILDHSLVRTPPALHVQFRLLLAHVRPVVRHWLRVRLAEPRKFGPETNQSKRDQTIAI